MKKNPWVTLLVLLFVFGTLFVFLIGSSVVSLFGSSPVRVSAKNSILHLEVSGVIMDGRKFIKNLKKYSDDKHIKAIVVSINSPGGSVGPSQEIYSELIRIKTELKKPLVIHSSSIMASGGYYIAAAGDKIVVQPGTLTGSIGVIMSFANMEKLYEWAKIQRYSITTGKYKDSGAEYRPMREDEKALFQNMLDDVLLQFKEAVAKGRGLKLDEVTKFADGRVMTGKQAVEIGFADQLGSLEDAYKLAASLAGMKDYDVFDPPKKRSSLLEAFSDEEDDGTVQFDRTVESVMRKVFKTDMMNQPMYLMPGVL